jgi:hypothetical protein
VKYTDKSGDTWADIGDDWVRVVVMGGQVVTDSEPCSREFVDERWGPLAPLAEDDEPLSAPSADLPTVSDVMGRASVFQAAHALVQGLEWDEKAGVYDVLQVAKWLEGDG